MLYNPVQAQFDSVLQREGKTVTLYDDGTPVNVIFRRHSDDDKTQNTIRIFYPSDSPIVAGKLITYNGNHFICLNCETDENGVYKTSDCTQTNGMLEIFADNSEHDFPVNVCDITGNVLEDNSILNVIAGAAACYTEDCAIARKIKVNEYYTFGGRQWQCVNSIYKDGIFKGYLNMVAAAQNTYTLTINADKNNCYVGDTCNLSGIGSVTIPTGSGTTTRTVNNPEIKWESLTPSTITVDKNGVVTALQVGAGTVQATWTQHNVTVTYMVTVKAESQTTYSLNITSDTAEDKYYNGNAANLTATGVVTTDGVQTTVNNPVVAWSSSDNYYCAVNDSGKITMKKNGTYIITGTWTEHDVSATLQITVVSKPEDVVAGALLIDGINYTNNMIISNDKTHTLTARVTVNNVLQSNPYVSIWSLINQSVSGNSTVTKTDDNGNATLVVAKSGTATIKYRFNYNSTYYEYTFPVTLSYVEPETVNFSVTPTAASITVGATQVLTSTVTVNGTAIDNPTVTYSVGNTSIALMTDNVITAVSAGTTTITATYIRNGTTYTAQCIVTVTAPTPAITVTWVKNEDEESKYNTGSNLSKWYRNNNAADWDVYYVNKDGTKTYDINGTFTIAYTAGTNPNSYLNFTANAGKAGIYYKSCMITAVGSGSSVPTNIQFTLTWTSADGTITSSLPVSVVSGSVF